MPSDIFDDDTKIDRENVQAEIRRYLLLFWRWIWLIILSGAIFAGSAYFFLQREVPVFETSTKVLVIAAPALQTNSNNSSLNSQNLVPTYVDLMTDESILGEVIRRLALSLSTTSLNRMVSVSPVLGTSTIMITIRGSDTAQMAQIANTLVTAFIEKINALQSDRFKSTKLNLQNELTSIDNLLQVAQ
jgi:capsular polysaccharide biosynthesis protein